MRHLLRAGVLVATLSGVACLTTAAAAQPPPEQPPPEQPPVEQPPPEQPPLEQPPVEQPPGTGPAGDEGAGEGGADAGEDGSGGAQPTQPQPPPPVQPLPAPPQPTEPPPAQPGQAPYGGYPEQPGYGAAPEPGYAYGPPPGPPVPIERPPKPCCDWSLRYDPFDLIFRRVTLEAEIAWGDLPLSLELAPSYIFDHTSGDFDARGVDVAARIAWYVQGNALQGFWLKAHVNVEHMKAKLFNIVREGPEPKEERVAGTANPEFCDADSEPGTCKGTVNSVVLGFMLGNSTVIPDSGGFALTGGIGIGAAVTNKRQFEVIGTEQYTGRFATFNEGFVGRLRLLGSLSLGVTF